MKRILIVLSICSSLFFVGCGGDEPMKPPVLPNMNNKNDQSALNDLMMQAMRAKQSCTQDFTPMFIALAQSKNQPGAAGAYGAPAQGGGMAQMLPMLMGGQGQGGGQGQCGNDLGNLLMAFTTIMVPSGGPGSPLIPYANMAEPRKWLASVLASIANRVGAAIQQQTGINIAANPVMRDQLLMVAANIVKTQIIPGLGANSGAMAQAFNQYMSGGGTTSSSTSGTITAARTSTPVTSTVSNSQLADLSTTGSVSTGGTPVGSATSFSDYAAGLGKAYGVKK